MQLCTATRAKKVVAGFTVLVLAYVTIDFIAWQWGPFDVVEVLLYVDVVLFMMIVPVAVLVINMIVIREVLQASRHSAANLGLQQRHQSTSSNSAVPTIMLIVTSIVYDRHMGHFLCGHNEHSLLFPEPRHLACHVGCLRYFGCSVETRLRL